jgi:hypothetical protein
MKAYAKNMGTSRNGEIQSFIALMRRKTFGKYVELFSAPKREALKCFGGTMTIDEFRAYGGNIEPPQVYWPFQKLFVPTIGGEVSQVPTRQEEKTPMASKIPGKLKAIETSSAETDTLRLKRPKPLARTESKLESALGIKRKEKAP